MIQTSRTAALVCLSVLLMFAMDASLPANTAGSEIEFGGDATGQAADGKTASPKTQPSGTNRTPTVAHGVPKQSKAKKKPRVLVTSDGEIDDQCSLVRFLLYANEWDIEGIITSSSQYHAHGHRWPGDDWVQPFLAAYSKVYPSLVQHDPEYPTTEFLQARCLATCDQKVRWTKSRPDRNTS
jgi:hypothetical protein